MKRIVIETTDRIDRLKRRLGIPSKRWIVRIKRGGWLTITTPMMRSLRLKTGDIIAWKLTLRGLEWQRMPRTTGLGHKRLPPHRLLAEGETLLCSDRPSFRARQSAKKRLNERQSGRITPLNIDIHPNE